MKTKTMNKPGESIDDKRFIIEKFCKKESINWPREMRNVAALFKKEPLEFWKFIVLGFKLNSLQWFNSESGKKEVLKSKKLFDQLQIKAPVVIKNDVEYVRQTQKKETFRDRLLK